MKIELVRVYDEADRRKGYRVLVDRLWPRGVSKESLQLDEWCKEIAPSTGLRKWFGHEPERWELFRQRYLDELEEKHVLVEHLRGIARKKTLVFLYSAKDRDRNQAVVLRDRILGTH